MRVLSYLILSLVLLALPVAAATIRLEDEGTTQGFPWSIDCVGAGVVCTMSGSEGVLTVGGGGAGNSFETMNVPAGTDPVADSSTDTLNLTETGALVLTGTAATDTIDITFAANGLGTTEIDETAAYAFSALGITTATGLVTAGADLTIGDGVNGGTLTLLEGTGGGTNFKAFAAPAAITTDTTCTLENDASFIPDSCVGNGTDDGGTETNSLEVLTTGILSTEIPIGTAADTVVYAALSGQATMTNGGVVTVNDVTCTNCLTVTEVASADLATLASTITVIDGTDATSFPAIFDSVTGDLAIKTDAGLTYDASNATLAATTFSGALSGNATTATALAADPADCATSTHFAVGIVASGAATCEAIADADVPNTITIDLAATVTTNANLTGEVTSTGNAALLGSFTSLALITAVTGETGTGAAVFGTSPTFTTSAISPIFASNNADPADSGIVRLGNAELIAWEADVAGTDETLTLSSAENFQLSGPLEVDAADPADAEAVRLDNAEGIAWEASPTGTDVTLKVDASEIMQVSGVLNASSMTEGTIAVLNNDEIDASSELLAIMDDETGTGALVFGTAPDLTISATTETNIEAAVDTLVNLVAAGTAGSTTAVTATALTVGNLTTTAGALRLLEDTDNAGGNFKGFLAPAAITADTTCTFEDDANFIPDSCVGNGTDDGGAETNSLEVLTTGIATTEIPIGTAADTVVYAALSGEATMSNAGVVTLADTVTVTGWVLGTSSATTFTSPTVNIDLLDGVGAVDMDYGSADITDHTFTTDGTGTAEIVLPAGSIDSTEILNATIAAADLASGALAPEDKWWPCPALLPVEAADAIPPLTKDAGTAVDMLLCTFDADVDEGRTGNFPVPARIEAGSTVTFTVYWYSLAATSGAAVWNIRHNLGTAADVDPDVTLTVLTATDTTAGTASQVSQTTITETQTNLAWVAGDLVYFTLHRDANNAADTLAGDALVVGVRIQIPLL